MKLFLLSVMLIYWLQPAAAGTRSSISVSEIKTEIQDAWPINSVSASRVAREAFGQKVSMLGSPVPVSYEDRAPLGIRSRGQGWLITASVPLEGRGNIRVASVVNRVTGRIMFAYTDSTGEWPAPCSSDYRLAETIKEAGWRPGNSVPDTLNSSIADVLHAACYKCGMDPTDPGQVIMRPRRNSPKFPATRINGNLIPVHGTEKVWMVQGFGRKLPLSVPAGYQGPDLYDTERFCELTDSALEFRSGFYMP